MLKTFSITKDITSLGLNITRTKTRIDKFTTLKRTMSAANPKPTPFQRCSVLVPQSSGYFNSVNTNRSVIYGCGAGVSRGFFTFTGFPSNILGEKHNYDTKTGRYYSTSPTNNPADPTQPEHSEKESKKDTGNTDNNSNPQDSKPKPKKNTFEYYKSQFKSKPGSHLVSFLLLHELTAILPIFLIYYYLKLTDYQFDFLFNFSSSQLSEYVVESCNRFFNKLRGYFGFGELPSNDLTMVRLVASYAIVKTLLPLRLAACVLLTPFFSKFFIDPITSVFRRIFVFSFRK
ncbi:hypothetical protein AX774_g62 [Zancudomyces culisetae]|uniref:Uncharacterized protein n=1 Tax=Zancudomyces culisetae TaxID=1213189 RepID=A0A1R1PZJ9_ZANCU|nr:hypothetical protein AX774_g62 [Zancudomyces culisetae]|eukprot:OMH86376.1 hypothetical protein AX774_g62 [Zancudomyces culisetae]